MTERSTVFKYRFDVNTTKISLPAGAKILLVGKQEEDFFLWAKTKLDAANELRSIAVYGTGQIIEERKGYKQTHLGTFFDGPFVWHVFEYTKLKP